jgi:hypothetical protein
MSEETYSLATISFRSHLVFSTMISHIFLRIARI